MRRTLTTLILVATLTACRLSSSTQAPGPRETPTPLTATPTACCDHESVPAGEPLSDLSLYHLDSSWLDTEGAELQLADLRGKIVVMALVYSSCRGACPRIIEDMRQIQIAVPSNPEKVVYLLVTIDPDVDTPARLKAFARQTGLDQNWKFLHGDPDSILELAALLGVKYKKVDEVDFVHSNIISVLDRQGELVHQQEGLGVDPSETVKTLRDLLGDS